MLLNVKSCFCGRQPWQNGVSERWVGSCRREILDHVIPLNEEHFRRLIRDYVNYHHEDRIHDSLEKDTPNRGRSNGSLKRMRLCSQFRVWVDCIIAMSGTKRRSRRRYCELAGHLFDEHS